MGIVDQNVSFIKFSVDVKYMYHKVLPLLMHPRAARVVSLSDKLDRQTCIHVEQERTSVYYKCLVTIDIDLFQFQ